jgi:glycosidase
MINVDSQEKDSQSILQFYRRLTGFVEETNINTLPKSNQLLPKHPQIIGYQRFDNEDINSYTVFINLSKKIATFKFSNMQEYKTVLYNYSNPPYLSNKMVLRAYEAIILKKEGSHES